ncbi:four helix bundle protein [Mesorhizobium sp. AR10]|uniref:four helix bundle protein n=1 Tax=Mesorhizobium sp. AR10 TaxID=2865839 RepID=UPI00215F5BE4|nr:four helix bundle protein [Mesorhizobium sp. AR10]
MHSATLAFPKIEQYALADQLRRSSKGICANLAEGFAKQTHSKAEFARFISMAMGSCSEVETWISYAFDLKYITQPQFDEWQQILRPYLRNAGESQRKAGVTSFSSSSIPQFLNSPFFHVSAVFPPMVPAHCGHRSMRLRTAAETKS